MRVPNSLESLTDMGIIQEVLRPLMSGKEAEVYLVLSGGEERVAKVYKEAQNRSFRQRAEYTEGRAVRNSRDRRAMAKRTKYGRSQDEAAWRSTEVDMIYRLANAGVRVPKPHHFIDGVLIMELVKDAEGNPAPRLGELALDRNEALAVFDRLIAETIRMLCAGVVHGDLSEFNVLMGADGPVVIDFPQAVDASSNQNARKLLLRDVDNLHRFVSRCVPGWQVRPLAHEMWELYARNQLFPDTRLRGHYRQSENRTDTASVMGLIADANRDERRRREALGLGTRGMNPPTAAKPPVSTTPTDDALTAASNAGFRPRRVEVVMAPPAPRGGGGRGGGGGNDRGGGPGRERSTDDVMFDASRQGGGQRTNAWARPANQGARHPQAQSQSQGGNRPPHGHRPNTQQPQGGASRPHGHPNPQNANRSSTHPHGGIPRPHGHSNPQHANRSSTHPHAGSSRPQGHANAQHARPNGGNNAHDPMRRDGHHAASHQPAQHVSSAQVAPNGTGGETRPADSQGPGPSRRRRRKRRSPGTPT